MTDTVECSICGESVGRMGIGRHAKIHRKEFRDITGRSAGDYQEVKDLLINRIVPEDVATLDEFSEGSA